MKLTTEEKQYLEIYLWKDYNEKIIMKKADLKRNNTPPPIFNKSKNNRGRLPIKRIN